MTPASSLITAGPSFTLDRCVKQMHGGVFRHLPIVQEGEVHRMRLTACFLLQRLTTYVPPATLQVKACISMRDVAQQIASGLSKKPLDAPPRVSDLMDVKGQGGCLTLGESGSVADAVTLMQQSKTGSLLITNPGSASRYGIFTERDYLTKVAVYDERPPAAIQVASVCTPSGAWHTTVPIATR